MLSHSTLVLALAMVAFDSPAVLGQADMNKSGEFSAYGGGAFGIGSHAAVGGGSAIVTPYAIFMLGVCLLACVVPTRRALSVEPTVALRVE